MSNGALVPVGDLEKMARAIAVSKLFGITNPDQALALMLVAQAEGLHPATVARDYHIIQGRPALKADAMLARYLASDGKVEWIMHTDEKVSAKFSHPAGGTLTVDWDMARAKKAGLGGKDMWAKFPRQMLRARVISEGIRATNPGLVSGVYTPEEVQDMGDKSTRREPKDMGKVEALAEPVAEVIDQETGEITPAPAEPPGKTKAPASEPIVSAQPLLATVLDAIAVMRTKPQRDAALALCKRLPDFEQDRAHECYTVRLNLLKAEASGRASTAGPAIDPARPFDGLQDDII